MGTVNTFYWNFVVAVVAVPPNRNRISTDPLTTHTHTHTQGLSISEPQLKLLHRSRSNYSNLWKSTVFVGKCVRVLKLWLNNTAWTEEDFPLVLWTERDFSSKLNCVCVCVSWKLQKMCVCDQFANIEKGGSGGGGVQVVCLLRRDAN